MIILPCLEFFFQGHDYVTYVFLLTFVGGLIYQMFRR